MKDRKGKSSVPILAAGGIVLRNDLDLAPRVAVVQSRKLEMWGLPKGKLAAGEDAMTAARREVLEETGHRVTVHEFLGTLVYEVGRRPKAIQFWRMEAGGAPAGALMGDVKAVDWLAMDEAIDRLSHLRERVFLEQVGPIALRLAGCRAEDVVLPVVAQDQREPESATGTLETHAAGRYLHSKTLPQKSLAGKTFLKNAWKWFCGAALLRRQHFD